MPKATSCDRDVASRRTTNTTHISVKGLAQRWDCNLDAIYRQVKSGQLPALHIGQVIRIPIAAVESYESENTTGARTQVRRRGGAA